MKLIISIIVFQFLTTPLNAQNRTDIIPGTKNNLFELSLNNNTNQNLQSIRISVEEAPEWVMFKKSESSFENIEQAAKPVAQFYFDVSETAPVSEEGSIKFKITDGRGRSWNKTYNVKVTSPKVFEVYQNYPNPFNPSTTIKYSIPKDAFVKIKVFNVLGEEVSELINKEMKTGIHEVVFYASNLSSGFYFYIVEAKGNDGTKYFDAKKMILLR